MPDPVLRASTGATSPGHWKPSSLGAAGGAADGSFGSQARSCPVWVFPGTWGVMPKFPALPAGCLVSMSSPQPSPWTWSAEHCPVRRGGLVPGSPWKDLLLCSPQDSAVVIFLSWSCFPPGLWHSSAQLPPQLGMKVSQDSRS